ncbi:MAG TPA: PEP-CTERM sorting domain-containing protein [Vicinamibacterales bacterium]|nr:PEP-CTERM sorting domain-containing protein [Vicinamibacterales bacterium]
MRRTASVWIAIVVGLGLLGAPARALATPITYEFTGTGSGLLGTSSFSSASFVVTLNGDTNDVAVFANVGSIPANENLTGSITIGALGTASFTETLFMFSDLTTLYGFGTFPPGGHGNLIAAILATVPNLVSNFGPVSGPNSALSQFHDEPTTLGNLTFRTMSDVTFRETTGAAAAPEPATVVLLASGLAAAARARRRSAR